MSDDKSGAPDQLGPRPEIDESRTLPPLDFSGMVISFGTSAMISLGVAPDPITGTTSVDLLAARHTIDMLEILQEKTRGNLELEEEQLLNKLLFDARVAYVKARE